MAHKSHKAEAQKSLLLGPSNKTPIKWLHNLPYAYCNPFIHFAYAIDSPCVYCFRCSTFAGLGPYLWIFIYSLWRHSLCVHNECSHYILLGLLQTNIADILYKSLFCNIWNFLIHAWFVLVLIHKMLQKPNNYQYGGTCKVQSNSMFIVFASTLIKEPCGKT